MGTVTFFSPFNHSWKIDVQRPLNIQTEAVTMSKKGDILFLARVDYMILMFNMLDGTISTFRSKVRDILVCSSFL